MSGGGSVEAGQASARPSYRERLGACAECGAALARGRKTDAFCAPACRKAFGNRRMTRGAELYDLLMETRFNRAEAKALGAWQALCRMASNFREEDHAAREGRISWRRAKQVLADRPYLKSHATKIRAGR